MKPKEQFEPKKPWQPMRISEVGTVAEVIQGGGGKMSITGGDTGDAPRKPKGQG